MQDPSLLDYKHAELLFIGEDSNIAGWKPPPPPLPSLNAPLASKRNVSQGSTKP